PIELQAPKELQAPEELQAPKGGRDRTSQTRKWSCHTTIYQRNANSIHRPFVFGQSRMTPVRAYD
ncbi:MAG TPA: hypothetical protein DD665_04650, partial [Alphaproteobacteria bacterium]|nr:hypothetical protein [Alphaproteobacteria bacterium]